MGAKFKGVVLETLQTRDTSYIACLNEVDQQRLQWCCNDSFTLLCICAHRLEARGGVSPPQLAIY